MYKEILRKITEFIYDILGDELGEEKEILTFDDRSTYVIKSDEGRHYVFYMSEINHDGSIIMTMNTYFDKIPTKILEILEALFIDHIAHNLDTQMITGGVGTMVVVNINTYDNLGEDLDDLYQDLLNSKEIFELVFI